ncbi:MAG: hypothetical protein IIC29_06080, partial [Chloroflexi bacterium]|nr:hypothetical protein [Chloroflexota bacterium]
MVGEERDAGEGTSAAEDNAADVGFGVVIGSVVATGEAVAVASGVPAGAAMLAVGTASESPLLTGEIEPHATAVIAISSSAACIHRRAKYGGRAGESIEGAMR